MERLGRVFIALREHSLKLKASKCIFGGNRVPCLGFIISDKGVETAPGIINAVVQMPTPTDKEDIRCFLGLCGYYRRFVQGSSALAAPLTPVLRKDAEFKWTDKQQKAFETLKVKMTTAPVLVVYDPDKPVAMRPDASYDGLGCVLVHVSETRKSKSSHMRVDAFRTLNRNTVY